MRRAIGIIRVSEVGDRDEDTFLSPSQQRVRLDDTCERFDLKLIAVRQELNVSGGKPLEQRADLLWSVEQIEAGAADVLAVAYFDRLVRSLEVQRQVIDRVEAAGGEVLTVDFGRVSHKTSAQWLQGTMVGAYNEYYRRQARERGDEAKADAVRRGIPPFPRVPLGYRREVIGQDRKGRRQLGPLVPDPETEHLALEAFRMRERGDSYQAIRDWLAGQGVSRSTRGVAAMFETRLYVGELHYGEWSNLDAHKAIIPRPLFDAVSRVKGTQGRRGSSDLLLARLGVLRCFEGARMVASKQTNKAADGGDLVYTYYRCGSQGRCENPLTIRSYKAEAAVLDAVREVIADYKGRAAAEDRTRRLQQEAQDSQDAFDAAIRAFTGLEGEQAAQERLAELREDRDRKRAAADAATGGAVVTLAGVDIDRLSVDAQRRLIRATVREAVVGPGRSPDRVKVDLFVA
jgi:DNA invertase Pin-like site-specific DNA recombinase